MHLFLTLFFFFFAGQALADDPSAGGDLRVGADLYTGGQRVDVRAAAIGMAKTWGMKLLLYT